MFLRRSNYKFSDKVHSKKGIFSVIIGVFALSAIVVSSYISSTSDGNGGLVLGLAGFLAMIITIYGLYTAINALKEKDIIYIFPIIGVILNAILLITYLALYVIGISIR